jgi:hypothetical protein
MLLPLSHTGQVRPSSTAANTLLNVLDRSDGSSFVRSSSRASSDRGWISAWLRGWVSGRQGL